MINTNLETIYSLNYGNDEDYINYEDEIKIHLENGEIIIGYYETSDDVSLTIEWRNGDVQINFEEIKSIDKLT